MFKTLSQDSDVKCPYPLGNILGGGAHAKSTPNETSLPIVNPKFSQAFAETSNAFL